MTAEELKIITGTRMKANPRPRRGAKPARAARRPARTAKPKAAKRKR